MSRSRMLALLYVLLALSAAVPMALFGYAFWHTNRTTRALADERIARSLDVLHEHALKVFQTVELAIALAAEVTRALSDEEIRAREAQIHDRLKQIIGPLPGVQSLWILDRDGRPLVSSAVVPAPKSIDNTERDYFRAQAAHDAGTYVGEVVVPKMSVEPVFTMSQRRPASGDAFTGVIAAAFLPADFSRFYARIAAGDSTYYALVRADGVFLARYPVPGREPARLDERALLLQKITTEPERGLYTVVSQIDQVERRIGYRRLPQYPIYVLAGVETAAVEAAWWSTMRGYLFFGLPGTIALLAATAFALQRTRRLYAEAERREAAEDALRQSQKMEALGQLTGGIAHDFNNLLTAVIGNLEAAQRDLAASDAPSERLPRWLANASLAAQRAAALTQRLVAFSRRDPLDPKPFDAGKLLLGLSDLLARAAGDRIALRMVGAEVPRFVEMDAAQFESAILNLVLNSRDAMPEGGDLTIEVTGIRLDEASGRQHGDLQPGEYTLICVTDTGSGMPKDVANRAFEPFFTTKAVGTGTGLGLSQVYGLAKQSGGHVELESEVGRGTRVRLYLPVSTKRPDAQEATPPDAAGAKHGETVLVVEDDEDVRAYVVDLLRELDYRVLEAPEAKTALSLLSPKVDLLLTDVSMPGMDGEQLAEECRSRQPGLKVLFMTGYADSALPEADVIQKPLSRSCLATRIRSLLDAG